LGLGAKAKNGDAMKNKVAANKEEGQVKHGSKEENNDQWGTLSSMIGKFDRLLSIGHAILYELPN